MRPDLQAATTLLIGIVTLRLSMSRLYLNFVRPGMRPWLLLTGSALVLFGVVAFLRATRPTRMSAGEDAHGHDHHHVPRAAWLLLLPPLTLFLVAPDPLGSFAAERQANVRVDAPDDFKALPAPRNGAVTLKLSEYVDRALYDEERSLANRDVRLVGFVSGAGYSGGPRFSISRFSITCCAADARAYEVDVHGDAIAPPKESWVEIMGRWRPPPSPKGADPLVVTPAIDARSVKAIAQPEVPYE